MIKKRGKDAHLNHEELVQCMEWKQSVRMNEEIGSWGEEYLVVVVVE